MIPNLQMQWKKTDPNLIHLEKTTIDTLLWSYFSVDLHFFPNHVETYMDHFSVKYRDGEQFRSLSNTLTLEQHRFELLGFTYTWIFFSRGWLNLQMQRNCIYRRLTIYDYEYFLISQRVGVPNPNIVQGSTVMFLH